MSLAETVRNLGAPRLVVAGDVMLDRYVFGAMERISPEAPIGVLRVAEEEVRLGGAGSVARNLAVLGARVTLCGFLGTGPYGDDFLALAADAGIDTGRVRRVPGRRTSLKTRLIARRGAGGQQVLRVDREDDSAYPLSEDAALTQSVLQALGEADLLVLSDYAKGALSPSLVRTAITAARAKGIRVLVDPKVPGLMDERYRGASVVTPNRVEASTCVGFRIDGPGSAKRAARLLAEGQDLEAAAITLDRDGICLYPRGGPGQLFDISPRDVYDVTGAGDMVISAMAMALSAGASLGDAVRLANLAAGLEVSKLGVVPISREELLEALHQEESPGRGKGRSAAELADRLAACRRRGQKIVFTNGCFDLLHAGHARLLSFARSQGDVLVVGLNSDASVRRLKGEGRPVTPEAERVELLSALGCVDHVLVFDEDTPQQAVEQVAPDVLVKGEDWREKGVVGREFVEGRGGQVILFPLTPGRSTTDILRRLAERPRE
ncbi:MAG: D-glycero-beta-D-manno-heptose 1-phosphate adenylyltransferase [Planctomycetes bacterium]|jgi:D-beta-D-heptose 7-phosphate kinase/D-beta-D-heptose 1-phosphate adenosyltransferase|nr:D-glycero-beta-D-manno-heptose 1-phosphate adenylyltransferase [Planctomycetota bacterium]